MNGHTYNTYSLVHSLSTIVDFALSHTLYLSHTLLCCSIMHLIPFLARAPFAAKASKLRPNFLHQLQKREKIHSKGESTS